MIDEDQLLEKIKASVKACEKPLREALRNYEALQTTLDDREVVKAALETARGPLQNARDALLRVSPVTNQSAVQQIEDALAKAAGVQSKLDAIDPVREALKAIERIDAVFTNKLANG